MNKMKKIIKFGIAVFALSFSFHVIAKNNQSINVLDKICKTEKQEAEDIYENGALTKCYFQNASLLQAYDEYRSLLKEEDKAFLNSKLVLNKNLESKCKNDDCISINYQWNGAEQLMIEQLFAGGETHLKFNQEKEGTRVEIRYFPD